LGTYTLALYLDPPITPEGYGLMPIGAVFAGGATGLIGGTALGAAAAKWMLRQGKRARSEASLRRNNATGYNSAPPL